MSNAKIEFTKVFESGILEGCKIRETMSFVGFTEAMAWVDGVNSNSKLDYSVIDVAYIVPLD